MRIFNSLSKQSREKKKETFLALLASIPNAKIMDVASEIEEACFSLIHSFDKRVDIKSMSLLTQHIESNEKASPQVRAQVGDARNMPYPDKHFDDVFVNAVTEHADERADQKKMTRLFEVKVELIERDWTPERASSCLTEHKLCLLLQLPIFSTPRKCEKRTEDSKVVWPNIWQDLNEWEVDFS